MWRSALQQLHRQASAVTPYEFDFLNFNGSAERQLLANRHACLPKSYLDFVEAGGTHFRFVDGAQSTHDNDGFPSFLAADEVTRVTCAKERMDAYNAINELFSEDTPDEDYFRYSADNERFNPTEFSQTLLRGVDGPDQMDGIYLLNPAHQDHDGEWESMMWLLGRTESVVRYPTFAHLFAQKYFLDLHLLDENKPWLLYENEQALANSTLSNLVRL